MKNLVIWIMCMIVVAAAALIITDKAIDLAEGRKGKPVTGGPAGPQDPALLQRVTNIEKTLESVRRMLQIPEPEPGTSDPRAETRDGETPPPPLTAGLGERLQWLEAELGELRRQGNRDLMQIYTRLRRRLDEMEAKLIKEKAPDSRSTAADLKKLGVNWDPDKGLITMEAAFVHPTRVLEFVAVAEGGSGHESLLLLNAKPSALKRALEMMGVSEAPDPPYDPARLPKDCTVFVYVSWPGRATPIRVEKLLRNLSTGKPLSPTPFVFTASHPFIDPRTWDERLSADINRNTISLTWNYASDGILACPDPAAESEHVWAPAPDIMPEPPSPATLYVSKEPRPEWEQ